MHHSDGQDPEDSKQSTADMTVFVQNLLLQMMGTRIDELEQSINDLKAEMGTDGSSAVKSEETNPVRNPSDEEEVNLSKWAKSASPGYPFLVFFLFFLQPIRNPQIQKVNHITI
ncbi:unnamed protein product [Spirodela intermedia]|uniref:Heat shock factor binding protein 1 n=1 Tax=Spirodela intermedia TaxID=51605 RepID=A0ABN7EBK4_SPIIN|nr:unnamed protein product [Spirodela intermedia]